jgi:hypothetical protein
MEATEFNKFLGSIQSAVKPNTSGVKLTKEQYSLCMNYINGAHHLNWGDWTIRSLSKCLERD